MAQVVTLSSLGTATIVLNPLLKSTTVVFSASVTSSNSSGFVEVSLDDPTIPGGPAATWALLSSATTIPSTALGAGLVYTVLSPIGMVRINSTLNSSISTFVLKALQSITA